MAIKKGHVYAVFAVSVLGLLAVGGIAVWQISAEDSKPDSTTLILLALSVILLTALFFPKTVLAAVNRINNLDILGVKIELQVEQAERIASSFPTDADEVEVPPRPRADDVREELALVADELRRKLRFIRDAVLDDPSALTEQFVVAHLEYLQIFERGEAELCRRLIGEDLGEEIPRWDTADRHAFLEDAWRFSWRFATSVFDRYARRALKDNGWFVTDFEQSLKHRADFLARHDDQWALVAARVAAPRKTAERTAGRLRSAQLPIDAQRLVVVPDHVDHLWPEIDKGPMRLAQNAVLVLRLGQLIANPALIAPAA